MKAWGMLMTVIALALALTVPVRRACALDIDEIRIMQGTDRQNGVVQDYFFELEVEGTGIANAVFVCVDTGKWGALRSDSPNEWDNNQQFGSMGALVAAHPSTGTTQYRLYFNRQVPKPSPDNAAHWEDFVYLGFATNAPTGYATITYPLHTATGVPLNPNYTWNSVATFGTGLGRWVVDTAAGTDVHEVEYDNDMTLMSWQPGGLAPGTMHEIEVSVGKYVGGKPMNLETYKKDAFTYSGIFEEVNWNGFTTIPEPMTAALVGTAMLALIGWRRRRRMG